MAKFDDSKNYIEYKGSFLIRIPEVVPCWHCEADTHWIDGSFEAPLCSEECEDAKWEEYFDACDNSS
jgi:hypothetical protein